MSVNKEILVKLISRMRWILIGLLTGLFVGAIGAVFARAINAVTAFRQENGFIIWLLPLGGLVIAFLYALAKDKGAGGTDRVIGAISGDEELPAVFAPLIFISTIITHLFGGSSGREGAALQLGGSLGYNAGKLFRMDKDDQKTLTMCGMSAAFSALFGTPLAASFFAMELSSVGIMYYGALLPCVCSALSASYIAKALGLSPDRFALVIGTELTMNSSLHAFFLSMLGAVLSVLFCVALHQSGRLYTKYLPNPYLRIMVGGGLVALLTFFTGSQLYNGAGLNVVELAMDGRVPAEAFLMKLIFTALTIGAGFKGGEIVPSLYIGATFGVTYSRIFSLNPGACAAVGMCAMFCGVTNCPVSSLLLAFELFGYGGMPHYLLAVAISFAFSGYFSLYGAQHIAYSKYKNEYINRQAR